MSEEYDRIEVSGKIRDAEVRLISFGSPPRQLLLYLNCLSISFSSYQHGPLEDLDYSHSLHLLFYIFFYKKKTSKRGDREERYKQYNRSRA